MTAGFAGLAALMGSNTCARRLWRYSAIFILLTRSLTAEAQQTLTWEQVRDRFERNNPTLLAGQINISESKAQEITAYLRPNPTFNATVDQIDPFSGGPPHGPFAFLLTVGTISYLHERQHKRELRLESARKATDIAVADQADLERTLLFTVRSAFVQTLQAKAVLNVARENLTYYDRVLGVSRERFKAGDLAQVDLDRLDLQRVQYESDAQMADVNLRTAKIDLLMLLNDRTPVEQFEVAGPFEFKEQLVTQDEFRNLAMDTRPDLKAAVQAVDKATTDHKLAVANGSTDPVFSFDVGRNPPIDTYIGASVSIPLAHLRSQSGRKAPHATGHRP